MIYRPHEDHPLHEIWPDGITGEIVREDPTRYHMRIKTPDYQSWNPETIVLVVPKENVKKL